MDLFRRLCQQDDPALLESSARDESFGRYSLLACRPVEVLTLRQGVLCDRTGGVLARGDEEIWRVLGRAFEPVELSPGGPDLPYCPGWIGYLSYELGRHIERLPARALRDTPLPDLRLCFYDALLVFDACSGDWHLADLEFDSPPAGAGLAAGTLRTLLEQTRGAAPLTSRDRERTGGETIGSGGTGLPGVSPPQAAPPPQSNFSPEQYRRAVQRCIDYIAAGDIFQVNLSQRFTIAPCPGPLELYAVLRDLSPSWYGALLKFELDAAGRGEPCGIVSSSPELFLRVRGRHVLTRPIKGTRPRRAEDAADRQAAQELIESPKDNAELAMIVDLLRNDLGRVCRFGSVRVTQPRRLEAHPTVFHLVASVEGELSAGVGAADLLRATFPGGSITGAPKIRAMEIIDELESPARGVYTGCIGHVGVDGSCEWNIAIRTIVWNDGRAHVQVGGGVVADSSPQGEYQETLDKARAMFEAIARASGPMPGSSASDGLSQRPGEP